MSHRAEKRQRFRQRQKEQQQTLNERRQREFTARIASLAPARILYCPLDIGKNVHWMRAESGAGVLLHPPKPLPTNYEGYREWQQCLHSHCADGQFDLLVVGHEPTGIYHETWCRHILQDFAPYLAEGAQPQLLYRFLNPYQVKLEREQLVLRLRKDDPLDLWAIQNLLQQGQGVPATLPDAPTAQLHQYVFFAHQATRRLKATRLDLLRQFDRIWPGAVLNLKRFRRAHPDLPCPIPIVETKPLERDTFRLLLEHCPNPYRVRELGEQGIIDLFHQHEQDCGPVTARRILTCAQG